MKKMTEEQPTPEVNEDIFLTHEEWLAAEVRQFFRAHRAGDGKAVELARFYLEDYLTKKTLLRHLSKCDPAWDRSLRPLDFSSHRWFDGWGAEAEFLGPGHLRLCGEVTWKVGQDHMYYDPLEFEIELCPGTGAFRRYVIRFGDSRARAAKVTGSSTQESPSAHGPMNLRDVERNKTLQRTGHATDGFSCLSAAPASAGR
jgi:hypothetical protein